MIEHFSINFSASKALNENKQWLKNLPIFYLKLYQTVPSFKNHLENSFCSGPTKNTVLDFPKKKIFVDLGNFVTKKFFSDFQNGVFRRSGANSIFPLILEIWTNLGYFLQKSIFKPIL
jgi:hypothetical protein